MPSRPTISIIGAGNIAQALAPALRQAGYRIDEVISRDPDASRRRARDLARRTGGRASDLRHAELVAPVIWLFVSDDAIAEVARALARRVSWRGKIVLHSSGALGSDALAALRQRGAAAGSLHPMMTFVAGVRPSLQGVPFAVEGDRAAVRLARALARDLGGEVFAIGKDAKPLYHALGSFSSPMIVATLVTAERVARAAGLSRTRAAAIMRPILLRTVENYLARGAAAAFSGPIQRADLSTIRKHLEGLGRVPGARDVYLALTRSALRDIPVRDRRAVEKVLRED